MLHRIHEIADFMKSAEKLPKSCNQQLCYRIREISNLSADFAESAELEL